ncbi:hypothetical protein LGK95_11875 [Clostridium algoriphilum]|uniref:hypothetical protein n=1 Tax=Clostridium algoriphilum TaxID=198347 RepID=UPI001CF26671|nr:hypothetical protein [Clostridium algoriphilum]MCB2294213.1 hypothetical protein [Clostridium algoriphilum]
MKYSTIPKIISIPLLKLDGENNLSNNEYKIHKELIKKVINGELTTKQIREVLNKKQKYKKN